MASEPGTINFPALLDDVITLVEANNHASATLTTGINNSVLLIPVSQISEFSASGYATILDTLVNPTTIEIVKYTSKSGSNLVVPVGGRGQQGTAAAAFSAGAIIEQRPTARHHTVLADVIRAMQGAGPTNLYTSTNSNTIANTAAETSIFTGGATPLTASAGSSRDIAAASSRVGTIYHVRVWGNLGVTGTPTLQTQVKLNSTVIGNTGAAAIANNANGRFFLEFDIRVTVIGASGSVDCFPHLQYSSSGAGAQTVSHIVGGNVTTVDLTVTQTINLTFTWSAASPSNALTVFGLYIERIR